MRRVVSDNQACSNFSLRSVHSRRNYGSRNFFFSSGHSGSGPAAVVFPQTASNFAVAGDKKRCAYKCGKCGQEKKGHVCPGYVIDNTDNATLAASATTTHTIQYAAFDVFAAALLRSMLAAASELQPCVQRPRRWSLLMPRRISCDRNIHSSPP